MPNVLERFATAWNVFKRSKNDHLYQPDSGPVYYNNGRSIMPSSVTEGSITTKIYNQIVIDIASVPMKHVRLGQNGRYEEDIGSLLNQCLTQRANIDQSPYAFIRDLIWTMFDEGVAVVVPVDTTADIRKTNSFDIKSLRVGKVTQWYPRHVEVDLYNDRTGQHERLVLPKENVAVITNPLYEVMNEPNSDLKRLVEKLRVLDAIDEQSGSGKLDLIIQLPYEVRNELMQKRADMRLKSIQDQLTNSRYGIAYASATEKITQLNRPVTNNLMDQITYLTNQVYSSLGLTEDVFKGTADENTMVNYYIRTVNPVLDEITSVFTWAFLSQTARTQGQAIRWFRSPFALVPMSQFAQVASTLSTSEIATSNEIRAILGWKPVDDERAEQLRNANINTADTVQPPVESESGEDTQEGQNEST